MKKKNVLLLIGGILGLAYSVYLMIYFGGAIWSSGDAAEAAGSIIATALVTPHMILVVLATIFNWVAWATNKAGFALTAGILYVVGGVLFLMYFFFVIPSFVLCFIGYAKLKKQRNQE